MILVHMINTNHGQFKMVGKTDANGPYVSIDMSTDMLETSFLEDFITSLRAAAEDARKLHDAKK